MAQSGTVTHTARPGDSLAAIARAYGTSANAMMAASGLTDLDVIVSGWKIRTRTLYDLADTGMPVVIPP
jgi:LysM repeat protein